MTVEQDDLTGSVLLITTQSQQVGAVAGMATSTSVMALMLHSLKVRVGIITPVTNLFLENLSDAVVDELGSMSVSVPAITDRQFPIKLYKMYFSSLPNVPFIGLNNDELLNTPPQHPLRYCNVYLAEAIRELLDNNQNSGFSYAQHFKELGTPSTLVALNSPTAFCLTYLSTVPGRPYKLIYRNGSTLMPTIVDAPVISWQEGRTPQKIEARTFNLNAHAYKVADGVVCGIGMDELYAKTSYDWRVSEEAFSEIRHEYFKKKEQGLIANVEQPALPIFSPWGSTALAEKGFYRLNTETIEGISEFKENNRRRVFKLFRLADSKDAVLISSVNRIDNFHKCSFAFMRTVDDLLKSDKNLRIIIVGNDRYVSKTEATAFNSEVLQLTERFPGRFAVVNDQLDQIAISQILAASDYYVFLSIAEVFANALSESMALGVIPIVSENPPLDKMCKRFKTGYIIPREEFNSQSYSRLSGILQSAISDEERNTNREALRKMEAKLAQTMKAFLSHDCAKGENFRRAQQQRIITEFWSNINTDKVAASLGKFLKGFC